MLNSGIFSLFLICVFNPSVVLASCDLHFSGNGALLFRNFGSRKIEQTFVGDLYLKEDDEIEVFCSGNLKFTDYDREKIITNLAIIQCTSEGTKIKGSEEFKNFRKRLQITCTSLSMKLYESNTTLPNCNDYMSYGIGEIPFEDTGRTKALCYDLDGLSIRYAKYLTYRQKNHLIPTKKSFVPTPVTSLDIEIDNFDSLFSFPSEEQVQNAYHGKQVTNALLQNQKFDFESLIQDRAFVDNHRRFGDLFNVMWWHNLRNGNWKFFMNALKERTENVTYMAYTGISGIISMPSMENCKQKNLLELIINQRTIKAPAFIYTYLKSLEPNIDEEFAVIAFNTPFYEVSNGNELCEDMCDQVKWLKDSIFMETHKMPVYGVVYCCRPNELVNILENFPFIEEKTTTSTHSPI